MQTPLRIPLLTYSFSHTSIDSAQSDGGEYMKYLVSKKLLPLHFIPKTKKKPQLRILAENMINKAKGQVQLSNFKVSPVESDDKNTQDSSIKNISIINSHNDKYSSDINISSSISSSLSNNYDILNRNLKKYSGENSKRISPYAVNSLDIQNIDDDA